MDPAQVEVATKSTVRFALARGYLSMDELREALVVQGQLTQAGRSTSLLAVLAGKYLRPEHTKELSEYYQRQLAAQGAAPSASSMPEGAPPPPPPPEIAPVEASDEVLARSVEMMRRPPEEDPQEVQTFMRDSAKALLVQPAEEQVVVPDKVFVALAKKAGYPSKEDLLTCRRVQLERVRAGEKVTLFEVVQERGVLPERRIKRFQKWAAMITRKDPAPLEDETIQPPAAAPQAEVVAPQKIVLHASAANFVLAQDVDGELMGASAAPASPAAPVAKRKRGISNAVRESANLVVSGMARQVQRRTSDDPEVATRQMILFTGLCGLACAIFGLAIGVLLGGFSEPEVRAAQVSPTPDPKLTARIAELEEKAALREAGDADWALLREVEPEDARAHLQEFARKHAKDPRARHAERFAGLLEGSADERGKLEKRYLDALVAKARATEVRAPATALELYDLTVALAPRSEQARAAREGRARARKRLASQPQTRDPQPRPKREPKPKDPKPRQDRVPQPKTTPTPKPKKKKTTTTVREQPPERVDLEDLWSAVADAYDAKRRGALEAAVKALLEQQSEGVYAASARGLLAFLLEDFVAARKELAPLELDDGLRAKVKELDMWRAPRALVRAAFYTKEYELARSAALRLGEELRKTWLILIDGPFAKAYPKASKGLTAFSPSGSYRVMADVGVTPGELRAQEKKMRGASGRSLERMQEKLRKSHTLLRTLGELLDTAKMAYGKLLNVSEGKAVYPTVYVFRDRAGFRAFGEAINVGDTENALGYYMSYYRILVFFEQSENVKIGLSRDTVETLLHEAFHQWIDLHLADTPPWFNEGMAEYFSIGAKITRKRLDYAQVPQRYPSRLTWIQLAIKGTNSEVSKPWSTRKLLCAKQSLFMTNASVNYAHAWSLIHFLGSSKKGQGLLRDYFRALQAGASREEAYDQVFGGVDVDALEAKWRRYALYLK